MLTGRDLEVLGGWVAGAGWADYYARCHSALRVTHSALCMVLALLPFKHLLCMMKLIQMDKRVLSRAWPRDVIFFLQGASRLPLLEASQTHTF